MEELVRQPGQRWLDAGGDPVHNSRKELLDEIMGDMKMLPHCNNIPDAKLMGFLPGALYGVKSTLFNLECLGYTITDQEGRVLTSTSENQDHPFTNMWDGYVEAINT